MASIQVDLRDFDTDDVIAHLKFQGYEVKKVELTNPERLKLNEAKETLMQVIYDYDAKEKYAISAKIKEIISEFLTIQ